MTTYVILAKDDLGNWHETGQADSSSPKRAIAAAAVPAGEYVAVPARSWKPLTVKVETISKVSIT